MAWCPDWLLPLVSNFCMTEELGPAVFKEVDQRSQKVMVSFDDMKLMKWVISSCCIVWHANWLCYSPLSLFSWRNILDWIVGDLLKNSRSLMVSDDDHDQAVVLLLSQKHLDFPWVRHAGLSFRHWFETLYNQSAFLFDDSRYNRSARTPQQSLQKIKTKGRKCGGLLCLGLSSGTSAWIFKRGSKISLKLQRVVQLWRTVSLRTFLGLKTDDSTIGVTTGNLS